MRDLTSENGELRGLSGQGKPGLFTLLGGSSPEVDSSTLTIAGGAGQVSATARMARAHRDVRLARVASGNTGGNGRWPDPDEPPRNPDEQPR